MRATNRIAALLLYIITAPHVAALLTTRNLPKSNARLSLARLANAARLFTSQTASGARQVNTVLLAVTPDLNSDDPFTVLGLDPTSDKPAIKRAYRRLALMYHPDAKTTKDSTKHEKERATAQFSKINWAYHEIYGIPNSFTGFTSSGNSSYSTEWTPPHRRTGSYHPSSKFSPDTQPTTDWRTYIPNYDLIDEQYDTGGDSFGSIFLDLLSGGADGGRRIMSDFVSLLENGIHEKSGTFSKSVKNGSSDPSLQELLQKGTLKEVRDELDNTELIVKQLSAKLHALQDEIKCLKKETGRLSSFPKRLELETQLEEAQAKLKVVERYSSIGRKRLLTLQNHYKELVLRDKIRSKTKDDPHTRERTSGSSWTSTESGEAKAGFQKDEGLGLFRRGRGGGRRRKPAVRSTEGASRGKEERPRSKWAPPEKWTNPPPHRRTTLAAYNSQIEKEKRLRKLKVDDEFQKLKQELGL